VPADAPDAGSISAESVLGKWAGLPSTASLREMWPFWLTLVLSLLITAAAWRFAVVSVERDARQRFRVETTEILTRIAGVMDAYEQVLRGSAALFASVDRVPRWRWQRYVSQLATDQSLYGIGMVGYADLVSPSEKQKHEQSVRSEGIEDYAIAPQGDRAQYFPIVYLEPLDSENAAALGFDLFSEPIRRAAMERARDSGEPALSGKVVLDPEAGHRQEAGVLLLLPIFRKDKPLETVEQRRASLQGFAFKPVGVKELIGRAVGYPGAERVRGVRFEIFDGAATSEAAQFYSSALKPEETSNSPSFVSTAPLQLFDRAWSFRFSSLPSFEKNVERWSPLVVLLIGLVGSALLSAIAWTIRARHIVVAAAKQRIETELSERRRAERALRVNDTRLRLALAAGRMGSLEYDADTRETSWSPEMQALIGRNDHERQSKPDVTLDSIIHPDDVEGFKVRLAEQLADVENSVYRDEFRIVWPDGTSRWLDMRGQLRRRADGAAKDILAIATDITERKQAEEREQLLIGELRHRGNNLLAVLQSIACHSLSGRQTLAQARNAFLHRLQSLARTDSILTDTAWKGAALADIVRLELEAFSDRTDVKGPPVVLKPVMAQTFALVIHELATNALKYGALSAPSGKVSVRWSIEGTDQDVRFRFRWRELDGPPVVPPIEAGFGSTLLARVFGTGTDTPVTIDFAPTGLVYAFEVPLDEVSAVSGPQVAAAQ
jgi:PAS domain S-box-containing protein